MLDRKMLTFEASDGLRLAYAVDDFTDPWKEPETVILSHAAMGSSRRLYAFVPHLCRRFRIVRPDIRGHGKSDIPDPSQLSLARLSQDQLELLDHLGVDQAHFAGASAGAIISMNTVIENPERALTLSTFAATPGLKISAEQANYGSWADGIQAEGIAPFLRRTIANRLDLNTVDPRFVDWFIAEAARNEPDLLCRFVGLMSGVDLVPRLQDIQCPMLSVVPSGDPIHGLDDYAVIRDRVPDCKFIVYEGMPHNITDAVPDRCAADLLAFLTERSVRTTGKTG